VQTGKLLIALGGHGHHVTAVAFAPDGKRLLMGSGDRTGSGDHTARLWDAQTGKAMLALTGHQGIVSAVAFSPDGQRLLTGSGDPTARLWNARTGKVQLTLTGRKGHVTSSVAFSPDGKYVVTGSTDQTARLWDAQAGKELATLTGHQGPVTAVAFSPDGKWILTGSEDQTARLWEVPSGAEVRAFTGHKALLSSVAFSPDGKRLLTGSGDRMGGGDRVIRGDNTARLWNAETGQELRTFTGHKGGVTAVAFSPDGRRLLTGSGDHDTTARLWDAATGQELLILKGHTSRVSTLAFSPDGRRILTGSWDKTARLWDAESGKALCRLVSFDDGSWAVVDASGRYDASNGGDIEGLHWVVGMDTIALTQLKERYYDPGLLANYLGFNREPLRDVAAFKDVKLYPEVGVAQKDAKKPQLDVTLTNRGGGIGRVVVLVNGKERTDDARPRGANDANADKLDLQLDLSADPRLVPGQKNTVEVLAYNADGYLCSRGLTREFDGPGQAAADPPALHAVVVGVSQYRGERLALRYAAKDADDFASALKLAAGRFLNPDKDHPERVRLTLLTAADADTRPSRANLVKALEALKATKPGDIVVVYLAGHGVTQGGQDGDWHYLTADAQSADLSDPEVRKQVTLSSRELTDLLKASPAGKQVLVLDTCHSGRLVEKLTEKRDVPGSQVRALERVKDRTGMHVLAGCAADSVSYEATRYGQGLLTYSLLLGMRGAKLREGEYVDVVDLFGYAAD
ncbi:MAG TPA: caspase family protein, partial [Gemmataceae bacterium]|nr:caspase family protein [Gemmataceae bacterium]